MSGTAGEAREPRPEPAKPSKLVLVAWALGECGGDREFVDKVDVAMFAFRSYPAYFAFPKYPDHPDVSSVRLQLYDLLKKKNSRLFDVGDDVIVADKELEGASPGFRLTPQGVSWWRTNRDWVGHWVERNASSEFGTAKSAGGRVNTEEDAKRALTARIRGTTGFATWSRDPKVSKRQVGIQTFFTAFGIGPRTSRPEYIDARDRIMAAAASDADASAFLRFLDLAFGEDYKRILTGEIEI